MADSTDNGGEAVKPTGSAEAKNDIKKNELPNVESPSLSPAGESDPAPAPLNGLILAPEPEEDFTSKPAPWRLRMRARHRRQMAMAASVVAAAVIGAIIGAHAFAPGASPPDTAALQERAAMERSITDLNKKIASLKSELDAGTKSARGQIAKISERLQTAPETTGSIPPPPVQVPTPTPRPAEQTDMRTVVLHDWRIFDVRGGIIAVEGHGDIFEIGLGAPLPGIGPVQQIKRVDGRWVVMTPKGMIISLRDRRYFEPN